MARYGFTGGMPETKILLLHALSFIPLPVTLEHLLEVVMLDERVDYFVLCQALHEMVISGHVMDSEDNGKKNYSISPRGYEACDALNSQLPASLKTVVHREARMLNDRLEREKLVTTETFTRGGLPSICCQMTDGSDPILHVEIMLSDVSQGVQISKNFKKNAEKLYNQIYQLLMGES